MTQCVIWTHWEKSRIPSGISIEAENIRVSRDIELSIKQLQWLVYISTV